MSNPCSCGHEPIAQMRNLATGRQVRMLCGCGEQTMWHAHNAVAAAIDEWNGAHALPKPAKSA